MKAKRETLKTWLRDAHAMDRAAIDNLERQIRRAERYPELQGKLREHLTQTRQNVWRIEECLARVGAQPSRVKDTATRLGGVAEVWLAGAASDEVVKHCLATYAYVQFGIASYTALAAAADACDEPEIRQACEAILDEKRATADWLREQLPAITRDHLERDAQAEPTRGMAARVETAIRNNPGPAAAIGLGMLALAAGGARRASRSPRIAHFRDLYFTELQELRSAEKRMEALFEKLVNRTEHHGLQAALRNGRSAAHARRRWLDEALHGHRRNTRAHRDQAMEALAREAEKMAAILRRPGLTDAGVIASMQMLAHHQIAAYGTAATWAGRLGFTEEQRVLHDSAEEQKRFDGELTRLAEQTVNREAAVAAE